MDHILIFSITTMSVLVGIFFFLIANNSNTPLENHIAAAYKTAGIAFKDIKDAERNGADVSILIEKFNAALGLIEQANTKKHATCSGYDSCLDSAITIFYSISKDSTFLKDEASRLSVYKTVTVMGILSLVVILSLLFTFYIYKYWKSFQRDKFLNMQIKERRDK